MKAAVVHDWLPVFSGAEQVVESIMKALGPSDLYTLYDFLSDKDRNKLGANRIITSYLQNLPMVTKYYRYTFPWCPKAIESFDLSQYDMIVSSSAAFAKGVICHPHQKHIAYVHTPVRYAWDQTFEYMNSTLAGKMPFRPFVLDQLHKLRIWDVRTAGGPDVYLANSSAVKRRIEQVYGREAWVLHPPVDITSFALQEQKSDYYVVASRIVPYKRMDLIVDAFRDMPDKKLIVCGEGPGMADLQKRAGPNVELRGHVSRQELISLIQGARAFLYAAYEDFGIVMAEAQAAGTPVIAYKLGGASDIVVPIGRENPTGMLFEEQSAAAIADAVRHFEANLSSVSPENCRRNAERFATHEFQRKLNEVVAAVGDESFSRSRQDLSAIL